MARKALREQMLTVPEVKKLLELIGEKNLDQFQRRSLDYVAKFSKVKEEKARKLVETLVGQYGLDEEEAIQITNCMPQTIEEVRVFLGGGRKIIETQKVQEILNLLDEYRK